MNDKRIHEYICASEKKLNDKNVSDIEIVDDPSIGNGFQDLGFQMDCGHAFEKKYGEGAFWKPGELESVIDNINDIRMLGSAVFSKWRYYNHWAMGESIRSDESMRWFNMIIKRMKVICGSYELPSFPLFEGFVEKIVLDTENSCFYPPAPGQEIRQRVTIHTNGNVSLTRYFSGDFSQVPPTNDTKSMRRYKGKITEKAMNYIAEYFREFHDGVIVRDAGVWSIELTNSEGKKWTFSGSMCEDVKVGGLSLSAIARKCLELPELWMFDGNAGDTVIDRKTIDDYTESINHPPMVYYGETEHFRIYTDEIEEPDMDTGEPIFAIENVLSNSFTCCGPDVSWLIIDYFCEHTATEKEVEDAIIYDIMIDETMGEDVDNLLKGIDLPISEFCKKCLHSDGDSPYNDGPDRIQCQMYYNDFKPLEVMFKGAECEFYEEL